MSAFGDVAELYERRRPSWHPELVAFVVRALGLAPGRVVAELGAGTGKFTRLLVPTGAHIVAVEPVAGMREQLRASVHGIEVIAGSAEAIPLPDAGVDAVVAAAAFHWFELDRALPELHRVLRDGGRLAIVRYHRDLDDPLQARLQDVIGRYVPTPEQFEAWRPVLDASELFELVDEVALPVAQELDADGLVERIATISYIARLDDAERARVLDEVRAIGEAQPQPRFELVSRSDAFIYRRL